MNNNVEYDYADDLRGGQPPEDDGSFFKGLLWATGIMVAVVVVGGWTAGWWL